MSPDDIHVILSELFVCSHDLKAFYLSLSDEKPVKRIGVVHRKLGNSQCVTDLNCQWRDLGRCKQSWNKFGRPLRERKLSHVKNAAPGGC